MISPELHNPHVLTFLLSGFDTFGVPSFRKSVSLSLLSQDYSVLSLMVCAKPRDETGEANVHWALKLQNCSTSVSNARMLAQNPEGRRFERSVISAGWFESCVPTSEGPLSHNQTQRSDMGSLLLHVFAVTPCASCCLLPAVEPTSLSSALTTLTLNPRAEQPSSYCMSSPGGFLAPSLSSLDTTTKTLYH